MADERVRLIQELENREAIANAEKLPKAIEDGARRADAATKKVEASQNQLGLSMKRGAQIGAQAMTAMSSGIGAITAATAASERAWLALGTTILATFAAGGPVAGGIALIAATIGIMTSRTSEAEVAAQKARAEYNAWLDDAIRKGAAAKDAMAKMRLETMAAREGLPLSEISARQAGRGIADAVASQDVEVRSIRLQLAAAQDALAKARSAVPSWVPNPETMVMGQQGTVDALTAELERARQKLEQLRAAARSADEQLQALARRRLEDDLIAGPSRLAASMSGTNAIRAQGAAALAALGGADPGEVAAEQRLVELLREEGVLRQTIALLKQYGRSSADAESQLKGLSMEISAQREYIEILRYVNSELDRRKEAEAAARQAAQQAAKAAGESLLDSLRPTISQGLASIIVDGIETGFTNASDIARQVVHQLLTQLLNDIIGSGLSGLFGLFGGGGGGRGGALGVFSSVVGLAAGGGSPATATASGGVASLFAGAAPLAGGGGCLGGT